MKTKLGNIELQLQVIRAINRKGLYKVIYVCFELVCFRVASGPPDRRTCLLHQKLQMLNLCIEEKRRLYEAQMETSQRNNKETMTAKDRNAVRNENENHNNDDEDEFFDCTEESDMVMVDTIKPEGRLRQVNELKLLNGKDDLYEPITLEPPAETEDQLVLAEEKLLRSIENQGKYTYKLLILVYLFVLNGFIYIDINFFSRVFAE